MRPSSAKPHYLTVAGRPIRSWMVTAALACASVAYVGLIFVPGQRKIARLKAEINEKQQHVLQSERLTAPVRQAELRLASTRQFSTAWHSAAPSRRDLVGVYARLVDEAKSAGLQVQRFDPQPAVDRQLIAEHQTVINLTGRFPQVFEFIRRIEAMPQTIWIRDLRLTPSERDSEDLQVELSLTIFSDRTENAD